ncbi:serine/threonine-protein kinase LMTK2-like [Megalops cyprinoides]|uniref:serine/threonine-protein kinase LMTK2-like n=1 Tax=Megalops cyprinoides TaxID=118141 RepID=UPI001864A0DA|nr:serine/threonine-protein kinase LMTK2-like [Megalops cyprinoides]
MENRHGFFLLLAIWILQSASLPVEGVPLPFSDAGATQDEVHISLDLPTVLSLSVLLALVFLLVNCTTCCKEREIDFKEFEDNFQDEMDFTPPAEDTPPTQCPSEVYTLAVPPVALPGPPRLQPPGVAEGFTASQVTRQSLSYIQEIGNGWFGKVLLSEMYVDADMGATRVVVKELKASAGAKEQNDFLQQADAYRVLQHPNLLQCLGQCVEAIPFLLVFEYCELGDLRTCLAQQDWMLRNTELLQIQKMACEIAAGLTHLHKHNFLHSDLALRNCFLTTDLTVKVGDYGIGPWRYKEDYITTEAEPAVPLRWMAPELISELHGDVITAEQTKPGNVWALGVTLWELLENAARPYSDLSDQEVLAQVIKEQQVRLSKPQLDLPYSDRWYEVLQFCWLPADKRATAEEVHRLLTYLRMQGQRQAEEDFEQRWDALRPNPSTRQTTTAHSSFPILERFGDDALGREVDELLTVTETSRGLSFEYVWEAAKHDHYDGHGRPGGDTTINYHSMFFPASRYEPKPLFPQPAGQQGADSGVPAARVPGILPVFDAHKTATGSEYYIQLEEQAVGEGGGLTGPSEGLKGQQAPNNQQYVVLQDIGLDESSTDVDFFHRSVDSKDSYPPESQVWSSSDLESPYRTNIFSDGGSKLEDPWSRGFLEMPEFNGSVFKKAESSEETDIHSTGKGSSGSFLGDSTGMLPPEDNEGDSTDLMQLLDTEKLSDNFLFLREKSLMKEGKNVDLSQDSLEADSNCVPEANLRVIPEEVAEVEPTDQADPPTAPPTVPVSPKDELLNFLSPDLTAFLRPLTKNETLVPSKTLDTAESGSNGLQIKNGPSDKEGAQLGSSKTGIDFMLDSTSESAEVTVGPTNSHQSPLLCESANRDISCNNAKNPSLVESLGASREDELHVGIKDPAEQHSLLSPSAHVNEVALENGLSEWLTSNGSVRDTVRDAESSVKAAPFEPGQSSDCTPDKPLVDLPKGDVTQDASPLLTPDPLLDQASQDSLLDDSASTSLLIVEQSAGTPDSLDSLDMHRLVGPEEELSGADPKRLQPPYRTPDSGYDTENLESPEWNSQAIVNEASPESGMPSVTEDPESVLLVPPEIIVSEAKSVVEAVEGGATTAATTNQPGPAPPAADEPLTSANQSHRDSAYFSDNESEPEKRLEDTSRVSSTNGAVSIVEASGAIEGAAALDEEVKEHTWLVEPHNGAPEVRQEPVWQLSGGNVVPELVLTTEEDWDKEVPVSIDGSKEVGEQGVPPGKEPGLTEPSAVAEVRDSTVHAKLVRTHAGQGNKLKEPDMEGKYLGKLDGAATAGTGPEDGMEADEEDENSDDSDDEARAYHLHSSSSDSEDDATHSVPVVVMDNDDGRNLKSLLKATSPRTSTHSPLEKKAVCFFDDVTLYLFDQEIPTKELGDHSSGSNSQVSDPSTPAPSSSLMNRFTNSESSTDEEGGAFEWDDDFSSPEASFVSKTATDLAVPKPNSVASRYFSPPPPGRATEQTWTSPSTYSRFSISPASIASFSLTHLTDSDTEQGGSSEDGEKE